MSLALALLLALTKSATSSAAPQSGVTAFDVLVGLGPVGRSHSAVNGFPPLAPPDAMQSLTS